MVSNNRIILERLLEQQNAELAPDVPDWRFFELFTAGVILKNYDLSYDEIESGQVGGGGDGGIDCIYGFINGELIADDAEVVDPKREVTLELVVIQSKLSSSFEATAVDRLSTSSCELLDLTRTISDLASHYNIELIRVVRTFRETFEKLATKFPKLRFSYYLCTKGDDVHPNVRQRADALTERMRKLFADSAVSFEFLGAAELLTLGREQPSTALTLTVAETISTGGAGVVALANLREYYAFITDDHGGLRRGLLDANVRDYEGSTEVNQGIRNTLRDNDPEDFWWLNNGVTIIAGKTSLAGKGLTLEDPRIVNGLQTSMEIWNFFQAGGGEGDTRNLLVRVVVPEGEDSRDKIIRSTNSQTSIPVASLRATDPIHRNIEDYLGTKGLYYDRRKNTHKNAGRPKDRIVSIAYLAQAVMAIVLREPDNSRARPSSLIKRDSDYTRVFSEVYPIDLYNQCVVLMRKVDTFMRSTTGVGLEGERNNLKFHLAMVVATKLIGKIKYRPSDVFGICFGDVDDGFLLDCLEDVITVFKAEMGSDWHFFSSDQFAKSRASATALEMHLAEVLGLVT